uniref:Beta-glucosidase n=1 Tax=Timema douglasi TaxID=61478 RepID=A0A7R8VT53_TIMDO|nr:unnamed protein product [Timema douglasi]
METKPWRLQRFYRNKALEISTLLEKQSPGDFNASIETKPWRLQRFYRNKALETSTLLYKQSPEDFNASIEKTKWDYKVPGWRCILHWISYLRKLRDYYCVITLLFLRWFVEIASNSLYHSQTQEVVQQDMSSLSTLRPLFRSHPLPPPTYKPRELTITSVTQQLLHQPDTTRTPPLGFKTNLHARDVAADSYHLYPQDIQALKDVGDIQALKDVGFGHYRFSISWPRVMPTGDVTDINQDGIDYYNKLIDALLADNITPLVTMYHWDLPQPLQDLGGWTNPIMVDYFEDYARVLYDNFGDRVKWWITFNEPLTFVAGYASGGCTPPQVDAPGVGNYLVAHTVLKSHARAYHLYDENYRDAQNGDNI